MTHRPSDYLPPGVPAPVELPDVPPNPPGGDGAAAAGYDPLRLCIFATIALLGWLGGPVTLVVFAALGFAGYWRARRAGLTRSRCYLRDTRLVLTYLAVLTAAGLWGMARLLG